ncbi:hypothetical protein KPL78_04090 [Roseomonas sp. HJA6]|uniref:Uncharacterized protein n=1 Tax=Roseomonas alba TaxID=2846776 RepID=A0ABS7A3X9_9PROT|nr:hypothetical protein [Neoroseomonas alba]MBW6397012.1 hypothetical protein [Neoroseomonas alba]
MRDVLLALRSGLPFTMLVEAWRGWGLHLAEISEMASPGEHAALLLH